jgi:6-phosphogluconolactonase
MNVVVCDSAKGLADEAARRIAKIAEASIRARGRFTLALSGGSTPERTYRALASQSHRSVIAWAEADIFWSDERFVSPDDPESNYGLARRALLEHVPVIASRTHRVRTELANPAAAAADYAIALSRATDVSPDGLPPALDLILLGLGEDGHTASLFPGAAALDERRAWVAAAPPGSLPPPVDRITMTFPMINAARHVIFLVSGASKGRALAEVLRTDPLASVSAYPAAGVRPVCGDLLWLLDAAAAPPPA